MEPPEEPVSGGGPGVAAPRPRLAKRSPATPRPPLARASPRTRTKAPPAKKAARKVARIPPKALDAVDVAADEEPERPRVDETDPCSASQPLQPLTEAGETPSPACPPDGAGEQLSQPELPVMEAAQPKTLPPASTLLPPESPSAEPAAKRAKAATLEATVPLIDTQEPELSPEMRRIIAEAIAQGIAAGMQHHRPASSAAPDNASQQRQAPTSSKTIQETLSVVEGSKELPPSEDKEGAPDAHGFVGLFSPALFKALLQKAKATAGIEAEPADSDLALSDPNNLLFSEPAAEKEEIPCPKLFLDVIEQQWAQPGARQTLDEIDKRLYNVGPKVLAALKIPTVDGPVAALSSSPIPYNVTTNYLKAEDRNTELMLRRAHQAAAWTVNSAMAASFFNRISLLWLKQMRARIPATDLQTHQDINNLIAAAEFSADATLNSAKFASRTIGTSVTTRRLLWLRPWQSDMRLKWKLACSPFKGDKLFGEALEPLLVETKDKKKVLPSMSKRAGQKSSPYSQPQRGYFQQRDRPGYGDRSRKQFQTKRPIRGNGSRSFPRSSRSLQSQPSRGPEATGDCSPKGFEEVEDDSPANMTQQTPGIQEIQNPVHTGEHPGGRHPEVDRSHRSTRRPYIDDSPTMDMQREPALPVQNPREDASYALGSPQDYPYSHPTVSGRHVDRIRLSPPRNRGLSHHDPGPSGSFRESGSQQPQEPLASYRQDAPPSSIYRDDTRCFPVPGQPQRSGEPDPIGPNGASRPRLTIVRQDGVVRLHRSRGTSGYQDPTMVPPSYPEIQQEQFNYRRSSPTRSPPVADITNRNQGMSVQGTEPFRDRYGRPYTWLTSPARGPDGRRPVDRRGMMNQRQPGRDPSRSCSPPRDQDDRFQPPPAYPSRDRSHQDPYDPPREHPLQIHSERRRQRAEPS